mgnify:CR=1 FL=1
MYGIKKLFARYEKEQLLTALKRAILLLSIFIPERDLSMFLGIASSKHIYAAKYEAWNSLDPEERLKVIVWTFKSWRRAMNFLSYMSRLLDLNIGSIVNMYYYGPREPLLERIKEIDFTLRDRTTKRYKILRGF